MATNSVQQKVDLLDAAVSKGDLINTDLEVVCKRGWKWRVLSVVHCLLRPIYWLFSKDPYQHYRVHNVSRAILNFCEKHKADLTTSLKAKVVTQLLAPLEMKTKGKYLTAVETAKNSILVLGSVQGDLIHQRKILMQTAVNQFAHQLHLRLTQNGAASICFAPLSIIPVLGMILKGMPEDRKQLFIQNIGLQALPEPIIHLALKELLDDISRANGTVCTIRTAQALAAPNVGVHESYKRDISNTYGAEIFPIGNGCKAINDWVSSKTNGQITNLVTPNDLQGQGTDAALLNAMYFEGKWEKDFDNAINEPFRFGNGQEIQVKMMHLGKSLRGFEGDTFRMLEIPYRSPEGHALKHLIFLPNLGQNLGDLEARLTPNFIADCRRRGVTEPYRVKMPKIDVNLRIPHLLDTLEAMGLPIRGSLPLLGPETELVKIIHQAKMKVDEKGTVAAAATAGMVRCMAGPPRLEEPKTFYIDHDFAHFIVDRDQVLFQGNVRDPGALVR